MQFNIFTLFPDFFESFFSYSLIKKALENDIIAYQSIDLREYGIGNYKKVDDYSFGGGGMLIRHDVLSRAMLSHNILPKKEKYSQNLNLSSPTKSRTIYLSPQGNLLNQKKSEELSKLDHINFICGHYEGVDVRFIDEYVDEELSIGNYVLMGGETAAVVVIEAIIRYLPKVMQNPDSILDESFSNFINSNLLEYDQYTRPSKFESSYIPSSLLSGNHREITKWRLKSQLLNTFSKRPEVFKYLDLSKKDRLLLTEAIEEFFSI